MIRSLADVHAAIDHYVENIPYDEILSMATHISTDLDLSLVTEKEMVEALNRRAHAGACERDIYASYINEAFLTGLEKHASEFVFQFSFGAEPLPFETSSRMSQRTLAQLAEMVSRHPKIRFQCLLASRHANQTLCTMCRQLPNLSVAGYWWLNFFPSIMKQVMEERLDMVPLNKQVGFFSDAYCLEWTYGKARIVCNQLAAVLAEKVECGQYTRNDALAVARSILYETPQELLGMQPAASGRAARSL